MDVPVGIGVICSRYIEIVFDDESSSDSDEDLILAIKKSRSDETPLRINNYFENIIPNLTDNQFKEHFRMTRTTFTFLSNKISPMLTAKRIAGRQTVVEPKQILAVLWMLGTPESYR